MQKTCDYCKGPTEEARLKCQNCGAPIVRADSPLPDFRLCPYCQRKLLALASPACNYCGRRLPDEYLKARQAHLQRINEVEEADEMTEKIDEMIRQTARRDKKRPSFFANITDLTDLFS